VCNNFACAGNKNSKRYNWKFRIVVYVNLAKITVYSYNFVTYWKERPSVLVYAELRSFKFTSRNLIFEQEGSSKREGRERKASPGKVISQIFTTVQSDSANCRHARRLCCDQPARRISSGRKFSVSLPAEGNRRVIYGSSQQIKWGWFAVLTRTPVRHTLTTRATLYLCRKDGKERGRTRCAYPRQSPDVRNWTAASMIMAMHILGIAAEKRLHRDLRSVI